MFITYSITSGYLFILINTITNYIIDLFQTKIKQNFIRVKTQLTVRIYNVIIEQK